MEEILATIGDLDAIDIIRKYHYVEADLVPRKLYELLIHRQPFSTMILKKEGQTFGYYSLIGVTEKTYKQLVSRELTEKSLDNELYIPIVKSLKDYKGKYLYILSVASIKTGNASENIGLLLRLNSRLKYIQRNTPVMGIFSHIINEKLKDKVDIQTI